MRNYMFWGIWAVIAVAWAYLLADGFLIWRALEGAEGGGLAWRFQAIATGNDDASAQIFAALWAQPDFKRVFIQNFQVSFWQSRFLIYGIPTIILALLALVLRPKGP